MATTVEQHIKRLVDYLAARVRLYKLEHTPVAL